jgi:hypothetical protein
MNYIIEKFDHIITSLSSSDKMNGGIKREEANDIIKDCEEEKERIRLQIMEEVFNAREERTLELLIDKYQSVFIRLIDQLYAYQQTNKKQQEYKLLSKALYEYLNELLYFLQIHYAKYFNHFQKMPFIKMEHIKKELKPKLETIIAAFQRTILNEKLIRLIIQPLEQFISSNTITYNESQYMKAITGELLAIDTTVQEEDIIAIVKKILISINFNSPELTAYLINELDTLVADEESVQGKLRILKYQLKEINQVTIKPEYALHNDYSSLKKQIINWLNEEILFYQTEQAVVIAMPNPVVSDTKIHTSLSVPQLALLFRLLKEEQLITNTNQSELLKVVSGCFTTMHKESFSYGHLHGKYYKIEQHTKRTVYDMLIRLLHLSRKIG